MKKLLSLLLLLIAGYASAEDGSRLWLRATADASATVTCNKPSPVTDIAAKELRMHWRGEPVSLNIQRTKPFSQLPADSYTIRRHPKNGISIESPTGQGILYGAYHLLRLQELGQAGGELQILESPRYNIRILNHWDNLDRTVERGYAGQSLWNWDELPAVVSPRYEAYARANASIGINATVLNNVNASPQILSATYLEKVKALADIFRPYGIKVYLSINFSSPAELGGLPTSDPLDKAVQRWWKDKANEIYKLIPDFGGFLVKANSEGLPGPQDFGRTHVDGANMIADALKPHKGIVMWRAFVYNPGDGDRAKQAYQEFMPFDGQFRDNVIIQVKNGPVDFQPREPFSPLFGAMKNTPVMPEVQITQEYLGFANHVAYLAPMWKECLDSDTYQQGFGSTVAKITDGTLYPQKITAIAGVTNIGTDTNWCGHHLAQANWYAFGRLAWNHELTSEEIANEWIALTFESPASTSLNSITPNKQNTAQPNSQLSTVNSQLSTLLLESREAVVEYMMPLGLHHLFAWGHHYGPEPWCDIPGARPDWMPSYYHKADLDGIGFNRTHTGSNATAQYHTPLGEQYNDISTCPENLILWFHHVPWDHQMKSGRTLWDELCYTYDRGVQKARSFQKTWDSLEKYIDPQRFRDVQRKLKIQTRDAIWWKDACLLYFQEFSRRPIPDGIERPVHDLGRMKQYRLDIGNHENAQEEDLFVK
ncbi:alpha-glucuronidase [Bacteroides sp. 51]|uniref:alpha-glucuronidase n=1 Tax=Bacteroides sp. 51 TaxID=2302938 RepID=UPI0013D0F24A|nr:alpha-glucuronidase [Bacteroides sp. 51]NDV81931.1 alpha-glucuronidase [Bacteroides sp. 51]